MENPELLPCPFCGGQAELHVRIPDYGLTGAYVECCQCHARSRLGCVTKAIELPNGTLWTPATPDSIKYGKAVAVNGWNRRAIPV